LIDIIAGQVDSKFDTLPSSLEHIRRGDLRALGILSKERSSIAPDIPTLEEAGGPGLYVESWYGLLAPADTPAELVAALNESVNNALKDQRIRDAYARAGYTLPSQLNTPDILRDLLMAEADRWYWTIKARGISLR
jgi:tripartite-type tricarboxylate transporter receptor subunit TctC